MNVRERIAGGGGKLYEGLDAKPYYWFDGDSR
jgi:hypothetical protein